MSQYLAIIRPPDRFREILCFTRVLFSH